MGRKAYEGVLDPVERVSEILFGLIVRRTDLRVFPTDEPSMDAPNNDGFDRFQHSSASPGSLVGIYHFSKDQKWVYVQTFFVRGWVHKVDLAIAKEKKEALLSASRLSEEG
jgi:hypothetical protein